MTLLKSLLMFKPFTKKWTVRIELNTKTSVSSEEMDQICPTKDFIVSKENGLCLS